MSQSSKPIPIAMPNALLEKIKSVCDITDLKQQEVIRLAIAIGLEDMRRSNYDIAGAIVDAAEKLEPRGKPTASTVTQTEAVTPAPAAASSSSIIGLPPQHIAPAPPPALSKSQSRKRTS